MCLYLLQSKYGCKSNNRKTHDRPSREYRCSEYCTVAETDPVKTVYIK